MAGVNSMGNLTFMTANTILSFENMDVGIMTTVLGIIMVFLILIVICLLIAIFSVLAKSSKKEQSVAPMPAPVANAQPASQNYVDDKQLVAVITAAIAASTGSDTDGFVVRRIRRVGNWNQEAIEQQQNTIY